jgi:hypothetical protein
MRPQQRLNPLLEKVRYADAEAYLTSHGWKLTPFKNPGLRRFEGPLGDNGEPIVEFLPATEQASDFPMRLREFIGVLSLLEERPEEEILRDLLPKRSRKRAGKRADEESKRSV